MKYLLTLFIVGLTLTVSACGDKTPPAPQKQGAEDMRKADKATSAASAPMLKNKTQHDRDDFVSKAKDEMARLGKEIDDLKEKTKHATRERKEILQPLIHEIEQKTNYAHRKILELNDAAEEKMEKLKAEVTEAIDRVKQTIKKYRAALQK